MEITIQQGTKDEGGVTRRNFKVNNGFYENSASNDGGVPVHYIIVAWFEGPDTYTDTYWDNTQETWVTSPRPQAIQDYIDKFYPHWDKNCGAIILGETNSDEIDSKLWDTPREDEDRFVYLQELAIKLAEEKGLIPGLTTLDVAKCNFAVTLYGYSEED